MAADTCEDELDVSDDDEVVFTLDDVGDDEDSIVHDVTGPVDVELFDEEDEDESSVAVESFE